MEDYSDNYAKYYDLLTRHKDYEAEVKILAKFLENQGLGPESRVLSVGCGTGSHERLLASRVREVVGIDKSTHMINYGRTKNHVENLTLKDVDLADLEEDNFDIVISLFNVANCVGDLTALNTFFAGIAKKLSKNGICILEVWNNIAAIDVPPKVVEREYNEGGVHLKRIATPRLFPRDAILSLGYQIKGSDHGKQVSIRSLHNIYLHSRELLEDCLQQAGFGTPNWYSALSEGMNPADENDRMLLFWARKLTC